jgi:hypothetical protein
VQWRALAVALRVELTSSTSSSLVSSFLPKATPPLAIAPRPTSPSSATTTTLKRAADFFDDDDDDYEDGQVIGLDSSTADASRKRARASQDTELEHADGHRRKRRKHADDKHKRPSSKKRHKKHASSRRSSGRSDSSDDEQDDDGDEQYYDLMPDTPSTRTDKEKIFEKEKALAAADRPLSIREPLLASVSDKNNQWQSTELYVLDIEASSNA